MLVSDIAHRIKSNYMMLGLSQQQQIAKTIEKDIKNGKIEPEALARMVEQLRKDTKMAYPSLEKELLAVSSEA